MEEFSVGPLSVSLFLPPAPGGLLYLHAGEEDVPLLPKIPAALAVVRGADWNRDFSPWPAPRAFKSGEDFQGGAPSYLDFLETALIPAVEERLEAPPSFRGIAGYSMAGLFALYAAAAGSSFDRFACVSGSLWFDGFLPFLEEKLREKPPASLQRAYFSLGSREGKTKNPRLAPLEAGVHRAADLLRESGADTRLELNPGGHFDGVSQRIAKGLSFLAGPF